MAVPTPYPPRLLDAARWLYNHGWRIIGPGHPTNEDQGLRLVWDATDGWMSIQQRSKHGGWFGDPLPCADFHQVLDYLVAARILPLGFSSAVDGGWSAACLAVAERLDRQATTREADDGDETDESRTWSAAADVARRMSGAPGAWGRS